MIIPNRKIQKPSSLLGPSWNHPCLNTACHKLLLPTTQISPLRLDYRTGLIISEVQNFLPTVKWLSHNATIGPLKKQLKLWQPLKSLSLSWATRKKERKSAEPLQAKEDLLDKITDRQMLFLSHGRLSKWHTWGYTSTHSQTRSCWVA